MKKRTISMLLILAMCLSVPVPCLAAESNQNNVKITVTNYETGEVQVIEVTPVSTETWTRSSETVVDLGYSAFIPVIAPKTRADISQGLDEGGVYAELHVVYTISAAREQIKVTKFYGSWTPSTPGMYVVYNRHAGLHNGFGSGFRNLNIAPTTNSFSENLDWPYTDFVVGTDGAPYAWSEADIRVTGMEGLSHRITVEFSYPTSF